MASSFHKDCVPWSRVVYGPCLQLQRSNLVSFSALCLEQVSLLWVFKFHQEWWCHKFSGPLFDLSDSPRIWLEFLIYQFIPVASPPIMGLTRASLHTPSRQLQVAMAAVLSVFPSVQNSSEHAWLIAAVWSLATKQRILPSLRYRCSIRKLQDEPSLSCLWVWEKSKCSLGNSDLEYLFPGWDLEQCTASRHCTEFVPLLPNAKLREQGDSGISKGTCITCGLFL